MSTLRAVIGRSILLPISASGLTASKLASWLLGIMGASAKKKRNEMREGEKGREERLSSL